MPGLSNSQQNALNTILTDPKGQFRLGSGNAQNFISGGQSTLSGLASQSSASGNSSNLSSGINSAFNGIKGVVNSALTSASNMAVATLYDQLGNSSNRINVSAINSILKNVIDGVSDIATLNITGLLKDMINGVGEAGQKILKDLSETQARLIEVTNKSGAFVGQLGSSMREELNDALVLTTKLGMSSDEFIKATENLLTSSGRMTMYSKEAIESGVKASIAYTKSSGTLLENNEAFRNVGYGIEDAAKAINEAGQKTLALGLNAKVLTDTLVKNIGKLNEYGFQGGIAGLTRMTREAQSLNYNMDNTLKIANDLFDPNKAIDMAANLSMIGGAIGDFGDPLRMIYDATNNVEGLQTSLINASRSLATYNTEQGRFEITGANLRRAKMMADTFGISMSDLTSLAVKANNQFLAMKDINLLSGVDNDQKEFLKNISTLKDGKVGFYIPEDLKKTFGLNDLKENFLTFNQFSKLNADDQKKLLTEQKKIADMKPEEVARGQFNATTQILNVISAMYIAQQNNLRRGDLGRTAKEKSENLADNLSSIDMKYVKTTGDMLDAVKTQALKTLRGNFASEPQTQVLKGSSNQLPTIDMKKSSDQNYIDANKNTNQSNSTQNVNITHTITASDSTMDAMTKHWSKNLQDLELIGVKINNNPKSFDSTRKVFTKK